MTILVVTPYAGSEALVKMTERMLESLQSIIQIAVPNDQSDGFGVVAINNAAARPVKTKLTWHGHNETNEGFGNAVNLAIQREVFDAKKAGVTNHPTYTHVLVLNNDLEFPDPRWLQELLRARQGHFVLSPCTDITATKAAVNDRAYDIDPRPCDQVSAFCWLVPVTTIEMMRKKFGVNLFHPDFTNYGSDDIAGAMLRSLLGPKPFRVVPRSFVRHLKARTANELGVKAGTKELLQRISNFKRARRLA